MLKAAVLVSGGGTNFQAILDKMDEGILTNVSIELVLSNNPNAYALERAKAHRIKTCVLRPKSFETREAFHEKLVEILIESGIDLVVLAGFLVVIPPRMVQAFPNRIINIHPSLIPAFCGDGYYGLRVHEAALARGVRLTGATVHFVDEGTDTGPILLQKAVQVLEGDTPEILQRRVMEEAEWQLLPEAIQLIADGRVKVADGKVQLRSEASEENRS
ncbi:MAG: phosphoribosylglycinamide formyltransferase [Lachnospiraceae bacterium]